MWGSEITSLRLSSPTAHWVSLLRLLGPWVPPGSSRLSSPQSFAFSYLGHWILPGTHTTPVALVPVWDLECNPISGDGASTMNYSSGKWVPTLAPSQCPSLLLSDSHLSHCRGSLPPSLVPMLPSWAT